MTGIYDDGDIFDRPQPGDTIGFRYVTYDGKYYAGVVEEIDATTGKLHVRIADSNRKAIISRDHLRTLNTVRTATEMTVSALGALAYQRISKTHMAYIIGDAYQMAYGAASIYTVTPGPKDGYIVKLATHVLTGVPGNTKVIVAPMNDPHALQQLMYVYTYHISQHLKAAIEPVYPTNSSMITLG